MPGPPPAEETHQIDELIHAVEDLRRRVAALEQAGTPAPSSMASEISLAASAGETAPDVSSGLLAALGRLLLGIAGAYLLRAITETGILPPLTGTLAGLAYAAAWLVSTVRISTGHRLSVAIHGVAAAGILAPLLWEATVRFHTLTPTGAAAALVLFVVLGQAFAWQRDHAALAAVTALAGSVTAIALIIGTLDPVPFAVALAMAAGMVEFGAWRGRALAWRWIIALAADFCAFLLVYLVTRPQGVPEGYASIPVVAVGALLIALVSIYVASTTLRTLLGGNCVGWFELFQVATVAALAIAGGLRVSHGAGLSYIGIACLAAGAACYLAAFTDLARKPARNFHAYATFALLLVLAGSVFLLPNMLTAVLWSMLALAATALGLRRRGNTPPMHAAVYFIAAALESGLLGYSVGTMTGAGNRAALHLSTGAIFCAVATALGYAATLRMRKECVWEWTDRFPAALVAALLCWTWAGLAVGVLLRAGWEASLEGTVRTALVALVAVALAWFGRHWNLQELIWILFPWMLFGAVKLVAEDFRQGRSATLFLSLLVYGATLIALQRLLRRSPTSR
ncbi:MAG: hypothetical protein LAP38_24885 [Acidobacteriia bacterium]|nr:hypothetical protein [Terriglobia bacterium]